MQTTEGSRKIVRALYSLLSEAKFDDGFDFLLERHLACVEAEVGVRGGFEGGADACEILHFSFSGAGIESLHVPALAFLERRGNIHFAEVFGAYYLASHLAKFKGGGDEASYRDDACIDEEFAYLCYATDVLPSVLCREAEIGVEACADVVSIEDATEYASLVKFSLYTYGNGALSAATEACHPYHDASLVEQLLFVLAGKHLVENGVNCIQFRVHSA